MNCLVLVLCISECWVTWLPLLPNHTIWFVWLQLKQTMGETQSGTFQCNQLARESNAATPLTQTHILLWNCLFSRRSSLKSQRNRYIGTATHQCQLKIMFCWGEIKYFSPLEIGLRGHNTRLKMEMECNELTFSLISGKNYDSFSANFEWATNLTIAT